MIAVEVHGVETEGLRVIAEADVMRGDAKPCAVLAVEVRGEKNEKQGDGRNIV